MQEDVSTGLYEKGEMSFLDKNMTIPAKVYFDYDQYLIKIQLNNVLIYRNTLIFGGYDNIY